MSEPTKTPEGQQTPPEGGADKHAEEAKTFDAEYVDKLRKEAAKYRTEAKANADAAKRLAEIEESQKSEAEKTAERIKALEDHVATAERDALRFKVASKYGIGDEDTELFLTASDEETLRKQAERLVGRQEERKKQGNRVPNEGTNPSQSKDGDDREFVQQLFDVPD